MSKISVIGAGNLGAAIANEIASRGIADELVLVDILRELAEGQALDIQHSLPYKNWTKVSSGDYDKIGNSHIVVVTAGKPRTAEMSDRLQLAEINLKIVKGILEQIKKYAPDTIIVTITNPMDIMNHFIHESGFHREKVIGSGGQLDSARLQLALGHPEKEVHAYVLGEHGHDQVPVFSKVRINGAAMEYAGAEKIAIWEKIKQASMQVIQKKGHTAFAPAAHTADMVQSILKDERKLLMCSANLKGEYGLNDVSLGVPAILGMNGIEEIEEWKLAEEELRQLREAGRKLKEFYQSAIKNI